MSRSGFAVFLALLSLRVSAIRLLREGPMIDEEGREYKTSAYTSAPEHLGGAYFEPWAPVHVQCTESTMVVLVSADLFANGRLVSPGELSLGTGEHWDHSECRAAALSDSQYMIEAELHACGSQLTISGDSVIYSNQLVFSPAASPHGITRVAHTTIPVSCHYKRTHYVSSFTQEAPLIISPRQDSQCSLKLMNDDWTDERLAGAFYMGDLLQLEASYTGAGQRQLFIDHCVATLTPDVNSEPRYHFIENHGCLSDSKEQGSKALFLPRGRPDVLRLQLDAFLFHRDPRTSIFITCELKVSAQTTGSRLNKACNYVPSSWQNLDGGDEVCRCCEHTCRHHVQKMSERTSWRQPSSEDPETCGPVTLGPLTVLPQE